MQVGVAACSRELCSRLPLISFFFFNDTATTEIYTLSLHDALPISVVVVLRVPVDRVRAGGVQDGMADWVVRSEEHTSELQSRSDLVCRLLLEKKKNYTHTTTAPLAHGSLRGDSPALQTAVRWTRDS